MKKLFFLVVATLISFSFYSCQNDAEIAPVTTHEVQTENENARITASTYDIRIELEDRYGNPVSASSTGLGGFWAQNQSTGQYYYSEDAYRELSEEITDLPEGTYMFGARDGYFDGASSKIVTISGDQEDDDGFIVVTLRYWSE